MTLLRPLLVKSRRNYIDMTHPILALAEDEARAFNHPYVGAEHLLLSLLRDSDSDSVACQLLKGAGVTHELFRDRVLDSVGRGSLPIDGHIGQTPRVQRILALAAEKAERLGGGAGDRQLLLYTLLVDGGGLATRILSTMGIDMIQMAEDVDIVLRSSVHTVPSTAPVGEPRDPRGVRGKLASVPARENPLARATSPFHERRVTNVASPRHDS